MKVTESLHVCHRGHTVRSGWNRQGKKKSNGTIKAITQVGIGIFFFSPPPSQKSQWMLEKYLLIILIETILIFKHRNPLFTFPKCSALSAAS